MLYAKPINQPCNHNYPHETLANQLMHYDFQDQPDDIVDHTHLNVGDATCGGLDAPVAGENGYYRVFDNTGRVIDLTTTPGLNDVEATDFSLLIWLTHDDVTAAGFYWCILGVGDFYFGAAMQATSKPRITFNGTVASDAAIAAGNGEWLHLAMCWDRANTDLTFYENGVQLGNVINSGAKDITVVPITNCNTGAANNGTRLQGKMADIMVFNTFLKAPEVAEFYRQGADRVGLAA